MNVCLTHCWVEISVSLNGARTHRVCFGNTAGSRSDPCTLPDAHAARTLYFYFFTEPSHYLVVNELSATGRPATLPEPSSNCEVV